MKTARMLYALRVHFPGVKVRLSARVRVGLCVYINYADPVDKPKGSTAAPVNASPASSASAGAVKSAGVDDKDQDSIVHIQRLVNRGSFGIRVFNCNLRNTR